MTPMSLLCAVGQASAFAVNAALGGESMGAPRVNLSLAPILQSTQSAKLYRRHVRRQTSLPALVSITQPTLPLSRFVITLKAAKPMDVAAKCFCSLSCKWNIGCHRWRSQTRRTNDKRSSKKSCWKQERRPTWQWTRSPCWAIVKHFQDQYFLKSALRRNVNLRVIKMWYVSFWIRCIVCCTLQVDMKRLCGSYREWRAIVWRSMLQDVLELGNEMSLMVVVSNMKITSVVLSRTMHNE